MKNFIYNTVLGGIFFLIPLFVLLKILNLLVNFFKNLGPNIVKFLGFNNLTNYAGTSYSAVFFLIFVCFMFGLLARWSMASRFRNWFEDKLSSIFPFYNYYKVLIEQSLKVKDKEERETVMLKFENHWRIGIVTDRLEDGTISVFLPFSPKTTDGNIIITNISDVKSIGKVEKNANAILLQKGVGLKNLDFKDL